MAQSRSSGPTVAIFGGGVGGLSVAQELVERDYRVTVFEKKHWGGKVRGMPVPGSGTGGRADLPGQHGFHFFPGFYKNLPDTMKRIPSFDGKTVHQHIVKADDERLFRTKEDDATIPANLSISFRWLYEVVKAACRLSEGIAPRDILFILARMAAFAGTCQERRVTQLDDVDWWDYVGASTASTVYQRLVAILPAADLIAVRPRQASTRTLGDAAIQWLSYSFKLCSTVDRLLDGPEEDVWVQPWVQHVKDKGADMRMPAALVKLDTDGRRITGAWVSEGQGKDPYRVEADYYVCALPVDHARRYLTGAIRMAAPSLARLDEIKTGWMTGVQYFLHSRKDVVRGHVAYNDAPWALTSVSQAQFWPKYKWSAVGDGEEGEAFSVIISEWEKPGWLIKKPAKDCDREEIYKEVLFQMNEHFRRAGEPPILDSDVAFQFLDPDIIVPRDRPGRDTNEEPLFVTTTGAWSARPEPVTEIPNLFLASDYVRSSMDFASAEGTNQVARRAVNGILKASGKRENVRVWDLEQPWVFAAMRATDELFYKLGLPAIGYWGATPFTPPPRQV